MQTILNFNIESTNEKLIPRTGVAILGEYLKGMNLEQICNSEINSSTHHKAYSPFDYIYPLILMQHSGGRVIDDIKERNRGKLMTKCHKANFVSKELKNGFNASYLPTSNFNANAFYFAIGTLSYNLFLLFKQILDTNLQKHTVKTIRYKLYNIAGKVISHARQTILKVNEQFIELLNNIRQRAYDVSMQ